MTITVATLVKNEAHRFLPSALEAWKQFADRIVALDDGSTDGTIELLEAAGAEVHRRPAQIAPMAGAEWAVRKRLWRLASDGADWVLHLDADQCVSCDPRPFLTPPGGLFRVYDLWGPKEYREDAWWTGHKRHWWPAVHIPSLPRDFVDEWPLRGWHSGHVPMNVPPGNPVEGCAILHYAYSTPELRDQKAKMYEDLGPHLTQAERGHARTIAMKARTLPLPFEPTWPLTLSTSPKP